MLRKRASANFPTLPSATPLIYRADADPTLTPISFHYKPTISYLSTYFVIEPERPIQKTSLLPLYINDSLFWNSWCEPQDVLQKVRPPILLLFKKQTL